MSLPYKFNPIGGAIWEEDHTLNYVETWNLQPRHSVQFNVKRTSYYVEPLLDKKQVCSCPSTSNTLPPAMQFEYKTFC